MRRFGIGATARSAAVCASCLAAQAPVLAGSLSPALPLSRDADGPWQSGIGVVGALALVLVIAVLVGWMLSRKTFPLPASATGSQGRRGGTGWLRRLAGRPATDGLRVMQSTRLGTRASVHVIQWDGRQWLLGCTEHQVTLLAQHSALPHDAPGGLPGFGKPDGSSTPTP